MAASLASLAVCFVDPLVHVLGAGVSSGHSSARFGQELLASDCNATVAYKRTYHQKTDNDIRCDAVLLRVARSAPGGFKDVFQIVEDFLRDGMAGVIPAFTFVDTPSYWSRWAHRVGELSTQLSFACDRVAPADWISTPMCRSLAATPKNAGLYRYAPPPSTTFEDGAWRSRCQAAVRASTVEASNGLVWQHHSQHSAMWMLGVEQRKLPAVWAMHRACASQLYPTSPDKWKNTCHGVGHTIAWFSPHGGALSPSLASIEEARAVCADSLKQHSPGYTHTCVASCVDGLLHESKESNIFALWVSNDDRRRLPELSAPDVVTCAQMSADSFFCYWRAEATWVDCAAIENATDAPLPLANLAGCAAAAGMPGNFDPRYTTVDGLDTTSDDPKYVIPNVTDPLQIAGRVARTKCDFLRSSSYAKYVACSFGPAQQAGRTLLDIGPYVPMHHPELWETYVVRQCAACDDALTRTLCQVEVYDNFAGAWVLNDVAFLSAFWRMPLDATLLDDPERRAQSERVLVALESQLHDLRALGTLR